MNKEANCTKNTDSKAASQSDSAQKFKTEYIFEYHDTLTSEIRIYHHAKCNCFHNGTLWYTEMRHASMRQTPDPKPY